MKYNITVYSSDRCHFCVKLKNWLSENNIFYINKDIDDEQLVDEFKKYKVDSIPFTVITDNKNKKEERIVGFQPEKIKFILSM